MKYENKILSVILIITMLLSFITISTSVSASASGVIGSLFNGGSGNGSVAESLLGLVGSGITKIIGANPLIHGLIAGAFSGISTYSKLNKADIPFVITKDKVNISNNLDDYSGTTE